MPSYIPHGWKYLAFDKNGWLYVAFGPPCNICLPPTSTSQVRHIDPENGLQKSLRSESATASVATSILALAITGSPRMRAIGWVRTFPSDKLNHVAKLGENFGYPIVTRVTSRIRNSPWGISARNLLRRSLNLGAHVLRSA